MVSKSSFTSKLTRDPRQRAEQYSREGRKQKAAEMYARAGDFRQAARLAIEAGDERLAVECSIRAAFEQAGPAAPHARSTRPAQVAVRAPGAGAAGATSRLAAPPPPPPTPPTPEQVLAYQELSPINAAELLDAHGHHDEAIGLFELVRAYRRAASSALALGQQARAARLFERGRAFFDAAVAFENAELLNDAARVLEIEANRLGKDDRGRLDAVAQEHLAQVGLRRVEVLRKQGKEAEAAALLRDLRPSAHSVRLLEESGKYREAIEAALQMGDAEAAVRLLRRVPDIDRQLAAQIYLRSGHAIEAGNLFAALGKSREAAEAYESGGDWAKAGSRWETAQEQERAAEAYQRARRPRDAARCYLAAGRFQLAAAAYAQAGDHAAAAAQYLKARQRIAAAAELLAAGERAEATQVLLQIADTSTERETATLMLVPLLLEDGRADEALRRLRQLPPMRAVPLASTTERALPARERLYWLGRTLEQLGNFEQAEDCYRELADPTVAHLDAQARLAVVRERRRAAAQLANAAPPPSQVPGPATPAMHPTYAVHPPAGVPPGASMPLAAMPPGGAASGAGAGASAAAGGAAARGPGAGAFTAGSAIFTPQPPPPRAGGRIPTDEMATRATTALTPAAAAQAAGAMGAAGALAAGAAEGPAGDPGSRRRPNDSTSPMPAGGTSRPIGTLVVGQVLAGRFQILAEIGQGGMGRVYKARDFELGDQVAIKVLIAQADDGSADSERLLREVQICRKITHPNVVRVYDLGRHEGAIFIIMELLEGQVLVDLINPDHLPPLARVKTILIEIASGLGEAHALGVVHRDLKPENVILTPTRLKILDFGIARMTGFDKRLTQVGFALGSPLYMSPEQIQGITLDNRSDLYSLGVLGFALIAGREPFDGANSTAIAIQHLQQPPPDLRTLRPDLPHGWSETVRKLLAKRPEDRYQSSEQVIAALSPLPID